MEGIASRAYQDYHLVVEGGPDNLSGAVEAIKFGVLLPRHVVPAATNDICCSALQTLTLRPALMRRRAWRLSSSSDMEALLCLSR